MSFLKRNDNLVVCSMVVLFWGHMIKKIGHKSRSTQTFTSKTYFLKYLCHLSLNKSLIYESFDRTITTKNVVFIYF